MFKSMLVGLDGSEHSQAALQFAVEHARRTQAMVVGLVVIDEDSIRANQFVPLGAAIYQSSRDQSMIDRARRTVDQTLERFSLQCAEAQVPSKPLEDVGKPVDRIAEQSQRFDLVVLGQKTYFAFATQDEPCDTLSQVLRRSPRPVVIVPHGYHRGETIVVAYDGSGQAARALQAFQCSGLGTGREIHVVSVGDDHVAAAKTGNRAVEFLSGHQIPATLHVRPVARTVSETILKAAEELNAAMLVMGAYGQPMFKEMFLGSVTRGMLQSSNLPLFVSH
jgi:nucleotide-binding universal stress UspA family protein